MKKITKRLEELFVDIALAEERKFNTFREWWSTFSLELASAFTDIAFAEGDAICAPRNCRDNSRVSTQTQPCWCLTSKPKKRLARRVM